ncbi:MAG TPA: hypothetical protein VD794_10920, partial [Flavisolibacter sp.]|nr:hypothetical protein [Flavisolibacter sp.]
DMYIYLSGENISKTFGKAMALMLNFENKQSEDKMLSAAKSVQEMRSLMNIGQYEKAGQLYEKLPDAFKKDKAIQLMNIAITAQLDMEKYKQALVAFEKAFGQDPSAQLPLFDFYLLNEEYSKALKVLDVMDASVKDPLLNYHRSLLYSKMNNKANSLKCLEQLYRDMPAFGDGILELMAHYIEAGEAEKAEKLMAAYRSNKALDQEKLVSLKFLYPNFAALNKL